MTPLRDNRELTWLNRARLSLNRAEMSEDRGPTRSHLLASKRRSAPTERRSRGIIAFSGPIATMIARDEAKVVRSPGEPAPEDAKVLTGSREIPVDAP